MLCGNSKVFHLPLVEMHLALMLMLVLAYLHVSTCPGLNLQATMDSDGFGIIPPRPARE